MKKEISESKKNKTLKGEFIRSLKFLLFSCTAGIIQIGISTLLMEVAKLSYWPSYLIGLVLSVVYNFTINRKYTFKSANNIPLAMTLVFCYYLVFTPLSTLWGDALTDRAGWNEYIVLAGTMVINFVTEFLFTRFVVYRNSVDSATKVFVQFKGKPTKYKLKSLRNKAVNISKNFNKKLKSTNMASVIYLRFKEEVK